MTGVASARSVPATLFVVTVMTLLAGGGLSAQSGEWPTLAGAGLEYISRSGGVQVSFSGQLDLETMYVNHSWAGLIDREAGEPPLSDTEANDCSRCHVGMAHRGAGGSLTAPRLRVFMDTFLGDHVYTLVEMRGDRGNVPSDRGMEARIEQAYMRVAKTNGSLGLQAGRFASPFGSYPLRHLTTVDPFIRPPLAYDFRTVMNRQIVPGAEHLLLGWQHGPEFFRKTGTPPVWDVPYQWGAMAFGRMLGIDFRFAAMNSAPSSDPAAWGFDVERMKDPSWVVGLRTKPHIDLEVGMSYSRGPWMEELNAGTINPLAGSQPGDPVPGFRDYDQEIVSADLTFARGSVMVRAEAMLDRWSVPNIPASPTERIYQLELQKDLFAGFFAAARAAHIDFRPLPRIQEPLDPALEWDYDISRFEGSIGYRLARNAGILLSAYEQIQVVTTDADSRFLGLRMWWAF